MMATDETADARIAPVATGSGAGGAGYGLSENDNLYP